MGGAGAHRVDIRVVAATNRSLAAMVENRLFRADLFYRLSGVEIRIPALRERREDVPALAAHFLDRHRSLRRVRLSASAMDALVNYGWPGNVRELERLVERAVALTEGDTIELDDLPPAVRGDFTAAVLPSLERQRHASGLGRTLLAADSRALSGQQARSVSRPWHQLSHAAGVCAAVAAAGRVLAGRSSRHRNQRRGRWCAGG